ncbi:MAG: DUF3786 domain-containing protein [Methanobacteriota archaeon]|nr:MAG: DUF3786 domain-containing protein [Euryarchaeota archaeon]
MTVRVGSGRKAPLTDALELAWAALEELDPRQLAEDLGAVVDGRPSVLRLAMLNDECFVDLSGKAVTYSDLGGPEVPRFLQVLILHYLAGATKTQLTDRLISFRELSGGALYYPAFKARTIDPLVEEFGLSPERLRRVAAKLNAEPLEVGTVGVKVRFFDRLPVAVILWLGDSEVSASASILYDASAAKILPTEDLTVVGGVVSRTLIKGARG